MAPKEEDTFSRATGRYGWLPPRVFARAFQRNGGEFLARPIGYGSSVENQLRRFDGVLTSSRPRFSLTANASLLIRQPASAVSVRHPAYFRNQRCKRRARNIGCGVRKAETQAEITRSSELACWPHPVRTGRAMSWQPLTAPPPRAISRLFRSARRGQLGHDPVGARLSGSGRQFHRLRRWKLCNDPGRIP